MKYVNQVLIILAFTGLGEALAYLIPLPIPAAIYGLVLMLCALLTGVLKPAQVRDSANFMISVMPVLYVPICVNILEYWGIISQNAAAILSITVVSTFLVFAVGGLVTQRIMGKKEADRHD